MIALAALLLAAAPALDCKSPDNTAAMVECAGRDAEAAEARLNAAWRKTMAAMKALDAEPEPGLPGPGYAQALLASQRAWLDFRSKECLVESYEYRGGTMRPAIENGCMAAVTRARVKQLEDMLWTR